MESLNVDDLRMFCYNKSRALHLRHVDPAELVALSDIFRSKRCQIDCPYKLAMVLLTTNGVAEFADSFALSNQQRDVVQGIVDHFNPGVPGRMEAKRKFTPTPTDINYDAGQPAPRLLPHTVVSAKAKKLLRLLLNEPVARMPMGPSPSGSAHSRSKDEATLRAKALDDCLAIFDRLGYQAPQYVAMYGASESEPRTPTEEEVNLQNECFFKRSARSISVDTVNGYRKDFIHFLGWVEPLGIPLGSVTAFQVAAYIHNQRSLGKTVPTRRLYALKWAEEWSGMSFHSGSCLVASQTKDGAVASEPPKKARCPSMDMIVKFERYVCNTDNPLVLRVYAGVCLTLVHGTLRWSDFQRMVELHLGEHVIYGKSVMKRRSSHTPWAATRIGFSGLDWGGVFFALLEENNVPGEDFGVFGFSTYSKFTKKPVSFSVMLNTMRYILVKVMKMDPEEAVSYTLHSWRHWYPTAGKQLRLPEDQTVALGHWAQGSKMPHTYDANINSLEVAAKQYILRMVQKHKFDLRPEGSFPLVPMEVVEVQTPECIPIADADDNEVLDMVEVPEEKASGSTKASPSLKVPSKPLDSMPIQVQNKGSKKIHLYVSGVDAICNKWQCGSPDNPRHTALFYETHDSLDLKDNWMLMCQDCFKFSRTLGPDLQIPSFNEVAESQPEISSCEDTDSEGDPESELSS